MCDCDVELENADSSILRYKELSDLGSFGRCAALARSRRRSVKFRWQNEGARMGTLERNWQKKNQKLLVPTTCDC
jgi:hypothetical protein